MGSHKTPYCALAAIGTSTALYLFSLPKKPTPPAIPLHGAQNCKYILDDSHSHTFTLSDGRKLGYADYGDPNGKPVLYQHGIPAYAYSTELPVEVLGAKYKWARGAGLL